MNSSTSLFYDRFANFYPVVDVFLRQHKNVMFELINGLPNGDLLEIGVGTGSQLHHYRGHHIRAIDSSKKMLDRAKRRNLKHIEFYEMSGESLAFGDVTFDYIVLSHVLSVVDKPELVLKECSRVLKPNGKIIVLNHFTPNNWLRYFDMSFRNVSKVFKFNAHFEQAQLKGLEHFHLEQEVSLGRFSYFKMLVFTKE